MKGKRNGKSENVWKRSKVIATYFFHLTNSEKLTIISLLETHKKTEEERKREEFFLQFFFGRKKTLERHKESFLFFLSFCCVTRF